MAERIAKRLGSEQLLEYALRALAARAHSTGELRKKLERRAANADDIPGVLARLREYGYIDDRQFARMYSNARLDDGMGKSRVLYDLRKRRVAPSIASEAVAATYQGTDEEALIEDYLRRKFRNTPLREYLAEPKHLASAYRRLRTAGFSSANVVRVLKRFAAETGALDDLESEASGPEDS